MALRVNDFDVNQGDIVTRCLKPGRTGMRREP